MTAKEVTKCRASLGAVQWVAVKTQPLACARCNLLLTELATDPKMSVAQEIQEVIRELRKSATVLNFFKLPGVSSWFDLVVVGLGNQAHSNRPKCGSTGGMLIFLCSPAICRGAPNPMILVHWKSWKLKRKSIGTNDAEVQALVETGDSLFRGSFVAGWNQWHWSPWHISKPFRSLTGRSPECTWFARNWQQGWLW